MKQCPQCHRYVADNESVCSFCGYHFGAPDPNSQSRYSAENLFDACGPEGKSRGVCALLAIFLGYLGIHYFYLGKTKAGIISILLGFVTCGLWGTITLIQGVLMLCMTNVQFRDKYVLTPPSAFPVF